MSAYDRLSSRSTAPPDAATSASGSGNVIPAEAAVSPSLSGSFPLHEAVFRNDVRQLSVLIRKGHDVNLADVHGNTPLHLSVMLGRKECVHLLCARGANINVRNKLGWSPISEAISYGNRQTISALLRRLKHQSREQMKQRKPEIIESLQSLGDFVLLLKWDFTSWLPLVSNFLPSDVCKISKKGAGIRLDTTLVDFNEMKWERGDITFLFRGDSSSQSDRLVVLDNQLKVFQRLRHHESEMEFEDEVDALMSSDIVSAQISTKPITFTMVQSGWLFKEDKQEMVGRYQAQFYHVNGMVLETRKRREHLSKEDLRKNKAILENFAKGHMDQLDEDQGKRKESLPPPPPCSLSWSEYHLSEQQPVLGRIPVCKESSKHFKATVAMSTQFPLSVDMLLSVLEVIAPQFKHFQKLRDFIEMKLPPGFPVKIDIPVLPTLSARVTFQEFSWKNGFNPSKSRRFAGPGSDSEEERPDRNGEAEEDDDDEEDEEEDDDDDDENDGVEYEDDILDDQLFQIPCDYKEDPYRFPDL